MGRFAGWAVGLQLGMLASVQLACDLSDLTEGNGSGASGSSGGSSGGGLSDTGGSFSCAGATFCDTFDRAGPPSASDYSPIRIEGDASLEVADGTLLAQAFSATDCTYADLGWRYDEKYAEFRALIRLSRSSDAEPFFLTINQGGASACLHLFGIGDQGLFVQTNSPSEIPGETDSEVSQTQLDLPPDVYQELEVLGEAGPSGTTLRISLGGRMFTLSRSSCTDSVGLSLSLGLFCHGGIGKVGYDYWSISMQ